MVSSRNATIIVAALAATALLLAVRTGLTLNSGGNKLAIMLPFAVPVGLALAGLALTRFEWFVLVLLAARASLDSTKLSPESNKLSLSGASAPVHGLDPSAFIAVGLILAGALWLTWRHSNVASKPPPLERMLCLFVAIWSVSIIGSDRPLTSLIEAVRILAVVVMLMVLDRLLTDMRRVKAMLVAVFASAIVPLLVAAYQAASTHGRFVSGGYSRIRGTFLHPNPYAIYLTFIIAMGVALLPHLKGKTRVSLLVLLCGCGVALVLTYTRTGWIATILALVVVGILQSKRLLGILFLGGLIALVAVPSIVGRFSDLSHSQTTSGAAGNSLIWRLDYWTQMLPLIKRDPATGIGLKMVQYNTLEQKAPHNDFVRAIVETGVLGLVAYLCLLVVIVRTARDALRRAPPGLERGIAVGFAACVVAFLAMSLVANIVSQVVLLWYFFAFAAAAIAVTRMSQPAVPELQDELVGV